MRINWPNLTTVGSAAILVGTMIFGLAYATGWALGGFLGLGDLGAYLFEGIFLLIATVGIIAFLRSALKVEPIVERGDRTNGS
jgi:hypothetical protein